MKYIWSYVKKYPWVLVVSLIGSLLFVSVNLALPTLLANIINESLVDQDFSSLWQNIGYMVLVILLGMLGNVVNAYASAKLTTSVVRDIRNDMYEKIQFYSHEEYEKIGVPSLITRMSSDAFVIMQFTEILLRSGPTPILMIIGSVVMIFIQAPSLFGVFAGAVPLILLILFLLVRRSRSLSDRLQVVLDKINTYARENLTGLRVIRAFAREDYQKDKFETANEEYAGLALRLNKLMGAAQPLFAHVMMWTTILTFWFALGPLERGALQVGTIVAFAEYLFQALFSIMAFSQIFMMMPRAMASSRRLQEVMDMPISIDVNKDGVSRTETQGYVEFDQVSFAYPDEPDHTIIEDISFKAEPGETVAFIGSTGSGKSSIIQLLPRLFDVSSGRVLVDGVDVKDYNLKALREKVGYVPQKINLFEGTIRDNLKFGKPDATDEDLKRALDIAQATEFVEGLDAGLDSFLSEGGSNFSGGQKQRLCIARAIVRDPSIYIFDDSFSALDYRTDAELRRRLAEVTTDATVLLVAQRVSSITQADRIIVLDQGRIVGVGKHEELLESNQIYQEIVASQTKEEEGQVDE